jgi:hypothetical protein
MNVNVHMDIFAIQYLSTLRSINWKIDGRSKNDSRLKILRSATKEN